MMMCSTPTRRRLTCRAVYTKKHHRTLKRINSRDGVHRCQSHCFFFCPFLFPPLVIPMRFGELQPKLNLVHLKRENNPLRDALNSILRGETVTTERTSRNARILELSYTVHWVSQTCHKAHASSVFFSFSYATFCAV